MIEAVYQSRDRHIILIQDAVGKIINLPENIQTKLETSWSVWEMLSKLCLDLNMPLLLSHSVKEGRPAHLPPSPFAASSFAPQQRICRPTHFFAAHNDKQFCLASKSAFAVHYFCHPANLSCIKKVKKCMSQMHLKV